MGDGSEVIFDMYTATVVDYQRWDEQIERDVADGRLDALAEEAIAQVNLNADL